MTQVAEVETLEDALQELKKTRELFTQQDIEDLKRIKAKSANLENKYHEDLSKQEYLNNSITVELSKLELQFQDLQLLDTKQQPYDTKTDEENDKDKDKDDDDDEEAQMDLEISQYMDKINTLSENITTLNNDLNSGCMEVIELTNKKTQIVEQLRSGQIDNSKHNTSDNNNNNHLKLQLYKNLGLFLDSTSMELYINDLDLVNVNGIEEMPLADKQIFVDEIWTKIEQDWDNL